MNEKSDTLIIYSITPRNLGEDLFTRNNLKEFIEILFKKRNGIIGMALAELAIETAIDKTWTPKDINQIILEYYSIKEGEEKLISIEKIIVKKDLRLIELTLPKNSEENNDSKSIVAEFKLWKVSDYPDEIPLGGGVVRNSEKDFCLKLFNNFLSYY